MTASGKGGASSTDLITQLEECFVAFGKGLSYTDKETVGECSGYALELSSSSTMSESVTIDGTALSTAIDDAQMIMEAQQGFMSAHASHYMKISKTVEESEYDVSWIEWQQSLSKGSQLSYTLYEMDFMLTDLLGNLTALKDAGGSEEAANSTILLDIQSILQTASSDIAGIQIGMLGSIGIILKDVEVSLEGDVAVNVTEAESIIVLISSTQSDLQNASEVFASFGIASTKALVAQDAAEYLITVANETQQWFDIIESETEETSTAATPTVSPETTTSPEESSSDSGNSTEMLLEEATDILMYWSFDSQSVDASSVAGFKNKMYGLSISFKPNKGDMVAGLNMWKHSLQEANRTLNQLIEEVYLEVAMEWSSLEETISKYSLASMELEKYMSILDNFTEGSEGDSSDDTTEGQSEGSSEGSSGGSSGGSNETEAGGFGSFTSRVLQLIMSSRTILQGWEFLTSMQQYEISDLMGYRKEISELARTGGDIFSEGNVTDLVQLVSNSLNATNSSMEALSVFAEEVNNYTTKIYEAAFFEEISSLANFSIIWLENMNETMNESDSNSTTTGSSVSGASSAASDSGAATITTAAGSTAAAGSTSAAGSTATSGSTSDSSEDETKYCISNGNDSLICKVEQLLKSMKAANASGENDTDTTDASATTEASDADSSESSSSSGGYVSFMESHQSMEFMYEEIRGYVYSFSRAMRDVQNEDLAMKNETIGLLSEVIEVSDQFVTEIKAETISIDYTTVETYYVRRNDTLMAEM
ncbi:hypothetical protein SK128_016134 [Halocaridina rubra]|uniref:Uncharacterized protein n=1 Tax=Halocaridina rubra TaxID=373956 RepID=A0AAN8X7P1_HALRR